MAENCSKIIVNHITPRNVNYNTAVHSLSSYFLSTVYVTRSKLSMDSALSVSSYLASGL